MRYLFLLLFLCGIAFGATPSWRSPAPAVGLPSQLANPAAGAYDSIPPRVVYRTKLVTERVADTVFVSRFDTVRVIDTIRDTVPAFPVQYRYSIRYALTGINIESKNPEWLDYASYSEIVARDTATLKVGVETIRTLGTMVDQHGNRFPQQDIITTGFTIQVFGDRATIEYRGKNSIAVFSGSFDRSGLLVATGEISETSLLGSFFPFSLFFGTGKKRIIIEILREAYL